MTEGIDIYEIAADKRRRMLGKGATVEQRVKLIKLAPDAVVRVFHDRETRIETHPWLRWLAHSVIEPRGGRTYVTIYPTGDINSQVSFVGEAICHEEDNYVKREGVGIAFERALLKLESR